MSRKVVIMGNLFDERRTELMRDVVPALGRFLSARDRSSGEVIEQLKKKQLCFAEDFDTVLEILSDEGWIDDERFARNRTEHRMLDGYGPMYIRQDLMQRSVPRDVVDLVLDEVEREEWIEAALVTLRKKERGAASKDDPEKSLRSALQYRGFNFEQTEQALRRLYTDEEDGESYAG